MRQAPLPRRAARARRARPETSTLPTLHDRASGVLLHLTSLPGPHGSGDLGREARETADWLASARQRWWQMLPVGPIGYGNSPYQATSAMAGNPLFIDLDQLVDLLLLDPAALREAPPAGSTVDYARTIAFREACLRAAAQAFAALPARHPLRGRFDAFRRRNRSWLEDWALYAALKRVHGDVEWTRWPAPLRSRDPRALREAARAFAADLLLHELAQFLFAEQWASFRAYSASRGIALLGDVPIFVAHDSADVWAHQDLFKLDRQGMPTVIAGVPPDYFSATGQRWGNPLYRWDVLARRGYGWWVERLRITLERFDAVRLDHFIGFYRNWEIPASEPTAIKGRWRPGPRERLFTTLRRRLEGDGGELPLVAEDLGLVTPEVTALRERFDLPGIRLLQFAFGSDPQAPTFQPHNYPRNCVVYTGTHDNDTSAGWWSDRGGGHSTRSSEQIERERRAALDYLGVGEDAEIHWAMIRAISASVANLAVVPAQDLLGLGTEARMNRPGTASGNWEWRLEAGRLDETIAARLGRLTAIYGRAAR
jgi:4-alpha-glucanotransferase